MKHAKLYKKIIFSVIVSITLFSFFFNNSVSHSINDSYDNLISIFNKTEAIFICSEIHFNEQKVPSTFPNASQIFKSICNNEKIDFKESTVSSKIQKYSCSFENYLITIFSRSENHERFVSVTIAQYSSYMQTNNICNSLQDLYRNYTMNLTYTAAVIGEYKTFKSKEQTEKLSTNLLSFLKATKINSVLTGNTISITGVSPLFLNQISIKNINFNIGIRSSKSENKTFLTIATPIIISEY